MMSLLYCVHIWPYFRKLGLTLAQLAKCMFLVKKLSLSYPCQRTFLLTVGINYQGEISLYLQAPRSPCTAMGNSCKCAIYTNIEPHFKQKLKTKFETICDAKPWINISHNKATKNIPPSNWYWSCTLCLWVGFQSTVYWEKSCHCLPGKRPRPEYGLESMRTV